MDEPLFLINLLNIISLGAFQIVLVHVPSSPELQAIQAADAERDGLTYIAEWSLGGGALHSGSTDDDWVLVS